MAKYYTSDEVWKAKMASLTAEERREFEDGREEAAAQLVAAELVYKMRTQAGLSQAELASRLGVRQPYVSSLECGGRTPSLATLMKLATATGNRVVVDVVPA